MLRQIVRLRLGFRWYAAALLTPFAALAAAATMLLAGVWMAWHLPAFVVSEVFAEIPVPPYLVLGFASSVVYTWLYNSTHGSILIVMVLHGSTNLSMAWLPMTPLTFTLYAAVWVVAAVALLLVYGPAHLAHTDRHRMP